jgi:HEPN domain-containing protein
MNELNIVEEWFRYAQNDLIAAKHCYEKIYPKQTEISSYHCQQCAVVRHPCREN